MRGVGSVVALGSIVLAMTLGSMPATAVPSHAEIDGSGSTTAANAINQWVADLVPQGLRVVYIPDGSPQGKVDFGDDANDFAVADVPFLGTDPTTGNVDTSMGRSYAYVPLADNAVAFPYYLKVRGHQIAGIRLSGETLGKIFTGLITNWDNPEITADNNGHALPSIPITPVIDSGASGTAYSFSSYLSDEDASVWSAYNAGKATPTQYWPRGGNMIALNGESLISRKIASGRNGAIGLETYQSALQQSLAVASVENSAGVFVPPTEYNVAIAMSHAKVSPNATSPNWLNYKPVYESTDPRAYPIDFDSFMILPTGASDPRMTTAKRQTLEDYAYYSICQGQREAGPIGYSPLPLNLVKAGFTQLDALKTADSGVDLSNRDVNHCENPTFIDSNPNQKHLRKIAPQPKKCQSAGKGPCPAAPMGATHVTATASANKVKRGDNVIFNAKVLGSVGPIGAMKVRLQQEEDATWVDLKSKKSDVHGKARFVLAPKHTAEYRIDVPAQRGLGGSDSRWFKVIVKKSHH